MCQHVAAQRVGMGSFAQAKMKERAEKTVLLQKRWLEDGLACALFRFSLRIPILYSGTCFLCYAYVSVHEPVRSSLTLTFGCIHPFE